MSRPKRAATTPTDAHEQILLAVETLEKGLTRIASRRPRAWRQHLLRDLRPVDECLRAHCAAAERRGGTLADVEIVIGRLSEVTVARSEHDALTALAADFFATIEHGRDAANLSAEERHCGARFAEALRRHLLVEIDLLQIRFILDVGVVD